jgi:hypothetical protein
MRSYGICRVPRHMENPNLRVAGNNLLRQFAAIHPWHDHVGEQQVNLRCVAFRNEQVGCVGNKKERTQVESSRSVNRSWGSNDVQSLTHDRVPFSETKSRIPAARCSSCSILHAFRKK